MFFGVFCENAINDHLNYDSTWHERPVYNWLASYFSGHLHCTTYGIGSSTSALREISAGIPWVIQGSDDGVGNGDGTDQMLIFYGKFGLRDFIGLLKVFNL